MAFPTETVYGLGAHALDRAAVRRLFAVKGRPAVDPVIVHVAALEDAAPLVRSLPDAARALGRRFWPGPLTIVLPRSAAVPDEVTAGLETVGIRVPAHPVAVALLRAATIPVAAPSANLFSRPSPTTAAHVLQDLDGLIDLVLDGGPTTVGVESTVVDLAGPVPTVLRPGAVTIEMLRAVLGAVDDAAPSTPLGEAQRAPGQLPRHYSPRAPLILFEGPSALAIRRLEQEAWSRSRGGAVVGVLLADEDSPRLPASARAVSLGPAADPRRVAAGLYAALRSLDAAGVSCILARDFAGEGLGRAIRDRLRRAATATVACGTGLPGEASGPSA